MGWIYPNSGKDARPRSAVGTRPSRALLAALILGPVLLAGGLVALAGAGALQFGSDQRPRAAARPKVDRFDVDYAMAITRMQVRAGPRPAGSRALRRVARSLRGLLPSGRFEAVPGHPGLRNIAGEIAGNGGPVIVIGAHYDTLSRPRGSLGANNAAAAVAAIAVVAKRVERIKRRPRGAPTLRFVFFDGEEPAGRTPSETNDFYREALRGSKAYVRAHAEEVAAMVLLDFIGNPKLRLPREGSSDPALWAQVRAAAGRVGAEEIFPDRTGIEITDDHTPFLRAGIPAVDLIDWNFKDRHKLTDTYERLDRRSIDAVGETIVQLVLDWDERARAGLTVLPPRS